MRGIGEEERHSRIAGFGSQASGKIGGTQTQKRLHVWRAEVTRGRRSRVQFERAEFKIGHQNRALSCESGVQKSQHRNCT